MATPDERIIRRLREESDELRERIRQLEERRVVGPSLPAEWPIPATIRAYLIAMASGRVLSKPQLQAAAADHSKPNEGFGDPSPTVVSVQLSRHRKALADLGISVSTRWGVGHFLEGESLRIVREALARGGGDVDHE